MNYKTALSFLRKLFAVLILMSFARATFVICNWGHFADEKISDILFACFLGIRTDISLLFLINIPDVLFLFLYDIFGKKSLNFCAKILFFIVNSVAIIPNFIDCAYFKFIYRRSGYDLLSAGMFAEEDMSVFGHILADFWYLVLLTFICGYLIFKIAFSKNSDEFQENKISISPFKRLWRLLVTVAIFVLCIRGGLQSKPWKPVDTNALAKTVKTAVIANNTMFNIIHTRQKLFAGSTRFMSAQDAIKLYNPVHKNISPMHDKCAGKNVVILILEGFSAEYCGFLDKEFKDNPDVTYTPFLDELSKKSLVFDGFANGVSSIDALTSIALDIPPLSGTSFMTSCYASDDLVPACHFFNQNGYYTAFFYGGHRNSCRFDAARKKSEMVDYFCKDEYDGDRRDLNPWGVNDEEFLQFAEKKFNACQNPFFATLFTLSTHHPFVVPQKYIGKFPTGEHPIAELIGYSDNALRLFFEKAQTEDWYKNTIFVLVADHINGAVQPFYRNSIGRHSIPMMIFDPSGDLGRGEQNKVMQHIDIMPTLMDLCGIDNESFMLGHSVFDENCPRFAISVSNKVYQLIKDNFVLHFDGEKSIGLYKKCDFLVKNNLINDPTFHEKLTELDAFVKAFLQQFGNAVINNSMTAERFN